MADKKNSFRFSLQFNSDNEEHLRAVNVLNSLSRSKADYVAKAICEYVDNQAYSKKLIQELIAGSTGNNPKTHRECEPEFDQDFTDKVNKGINAFRKG